MAVFERSRKTVCIFGLSGFVGSNLAQTLKKDFRVVGTYHHTPVSIPGVFALPCDVLNRDQVQMALYQFKPDFTIYCIGLNSLESNHYHQKLGDALNTAGVFNVTEYSERYKSRMVLLSTPHVFNGSDKDYVENDNPDPNTVFGKTKSAAEFFIQKSCLNYLILRCCSFYGRSYNPRQTTFFESLERGLMQGRELKIDNHIYEGWLDVDYLGAILKLCIERNLTNRLFQVTSKNSVTRYDFAKKYAEIFDNKVSLVQKGAWPFYHLEGYPGSSQGIHYRMDPFNIESFLSVDFPTVEESLRYTLRKYGGSEEKKKVKSKTSGVSYL